MEEYVGIDCAVEKSERPSWIVIGPLNKLSLTALMEPPVFGVMKPLTVADPGSRTG